jgi:uncharacterized surface protein with fasciclin (FAS1) repeats
MSSVKLRLLAAVSVSLALAGPVSFAAPATKPASGHHHHEGHDHDHGDANDLNGVLAKTDSLSTFVGLLKQSGLDEEIEGKGPYTVFAPTNAAFDKLPEATLNTLADEKNAAQLQKVLSAHIVKGKLSAADLKPGTELTTLAGTKLAVTARDGAVLIAGVPVAKPDIAAEDGVIHTIDSVLPQ